MTSIPMAQIKETGEIIDPIDAWRKHRKGQIPDAAQFVCPGDCCGAEAILVNKGRAQEDMKRVPHFRVQSHGPLCEFRFGDCEDGRSVDEVSEEEQEPKPGTPDVAVIDEPRERQERQQAKAGGGEPRERVAQWRFGSLSPLASHFQHVHNQDQLAERLLKISGDERPYNEWFLSAFGRPDAFRQPIDRMMIYWGNAKVKRSRKDDGYSISFQTCSAKEKPSYFVRGFLSDKKLDSNSYGELLRRGIEGLIDRYDHKCVAFIAGKIIQVDPVDKDDPESSRFSALLSTGTRSVALFSSDWWDGWQSRSSRSD